MTWYCPPHVVYSKQFLLLPMPHATWELLVCSFTRNIRFQLHFLTVHTRMHVRVGCSSHVLPVCREPVICTCRNHLSTAHLDYTRPAILLSGSSHGVGARTPVVSTHADLLAVLASLAPVVVAKNSDPLWFPVVPEWPRAPVTAATSNSYINSISLQP